MKTLHLSIITVVGIIVISMATLGVFLEKLNDNPYTTVNTNDGQKLGSLSEKNCGQFYTVPEDKSNSHTIPVLILKQNSAGCAKVTFTVNFLFNNTNDCMGCNSQMVKIGNMISIGKYNYTGNRNYFGISNVDATHMFKIETIPDVIDISKYSIGSNFMAIFIITPQPNATGFYDHSIVKPVCNAYPLAVGYSQESNKFL